VRSLAVLVGAFASAAMHDALCDLMGKTGVAACAPRSRTHEFAFEL
jgi:hypothetical protein